MASLDRWPEVVGQWQRQWLKEGGQEPKMRSIGLLNLALFAAESRDRQGDLHCRSGVIRCVKELLALEGNSRNFK